MKTRVLQFIISLGATAVLVWALLSEQGLAELAEIILATDRQLLLVYLLLSISALLLRALRYTVVLRGMSDQSWSISFPQALLITAIRNALVDFLPARLGEASYIYVTSRYGVPIRTAVSSFGFCFFLDIVVLFCIIGLAVFAGAAMTASFSVTTLAVCFAFLLFSVGATFLALRYGEHVCSFLAASVGKGATDAGSRVGRIRLSLERLLEAWSGELERVRLSGKAYQILGITFLLRAAKYISLYVLLLAVVTQWNVRAVDLPSLQVILAFIAAEAGASLPISGLMGFGAYEGAWTLVFSTICTGKCEVIPATTVAFSVHLITQVVGYSIGITALLCFVWHERLSKSSKVAAA